jgi:hypothetical protein
LKPFEKKFLKKWFSPQISSKPQSPQETEHEKIGKRKTPRVSSNKRGSQYFERRKTLQLQKSLSKIIEKVFSPSIIPFQKPFPKLLRKFS